MPSTDLGAKPARTALSAPSLSAPALSTGDRLAQLNALHLYGMATAWNELLAEGPRRPMQPEAWLDRLIEAELADRQVRSLRYQLKAAATSWKPETILSASNSAKNSRKQAD